MTEASCFAGLRTEEPFGPATLEHVRRCPARSEYIELVDDPRPRRVDVE